MQFSTLKLFQEAENALNQYFADDKYVDITCPKGQASKILIILAPLLGWISDAPSASVSPFSFSA